MVALHLKTREKRVIYKYLPIIMDFFMDFYCFFFLKFVEFSLELFGLKLLLLHFGMYQYEHTNLSLSVNMLENDCYVASACDIDTE